MIDYPNNYKSSLSYLPRKGQEMDNNFIKILREMDTKTQLSVELRGYDKDCIQSRIQGLLQE